jgi:preprotein translocase subunit SecG
MSFLYPSFLWALFAIAIPILIHLFYFRRYKTIYFTNVRFLKEVKEQTSSSQRIRNLLVLLMRILAVVFLVLAFAQPFIAKKGAALQDGAKDVSIFFDNSFSMSAESEDVRLLEKARRRAEEILAAYGPNDRIQILTSDFEGRDQRLVSKDDALSRLREVQTSYNTKAMSKVLSRQKQALESGENKNKEIYIISDFQKNAMDLQSYNDTTIALNLVPLQSVQNRNISIDTAWFESPVQSLNQPNALVVKVRNLGEVEMPNIRLSLTLNGEVRPIGTLTLPPQTAVYDTVNVTITKTGWYEAKLNVTDFPIEFDNDYYFTFYVKEKVNILSIHDGQVNRFIKASFDGNDYFDAIHQPVGQLDYSKLPDYDLVIVSELRSIASGLIAELKTFVENGGNVVVFPHAEAKVDEYNKLNQAFNANIIGAFDQNERTVSFINFQDFIFFDVFEERRDNLKLPITTANFKVNKRASSREEVLLRYRDGGTFLAKYALEKGNYYFCAAPLDVEYSDLVKNGEIFVPMLYRMALATGRERKIAYTIGKDNVLESTNKTSASEMVYKIGASTGEFIPEQRKIGSRLILGINNQAKLAGFYNLYFKPEEVLDKFGFNFDRKESALSFYNIDDLKKQVGDLPTIIDGTKTQDFQGKIESEKKGTALWKWCLILTLLFLFIEILLVRLWDTKGGK